MSDPHLEHLLKRSVDERLEAIGRLWDSLETETALDPEVAKELERRRAELEAGGGDLIDGNDLLARIRQQIK
jgi:putative addiction module component (TIGR02574 family)